MEYREDVEMDVEDSVPEKEKQKQKRMEGGVSPGLKRARLDEEIYHAQIPADEIPADEEMEPRISHLTEEEEEEEEVDEDEEEEEEEEKMVPWKEVMTEEEKQLMLNMNKYMMDAYGTTDLEMIDHKISTAMRDLYGPEEEWDEDKDKDKEKEKEKETEVDENIIEILKNVDSKSHCMADVTCRSRNVPDQDSIVLYPWEDMECTTDDMTVPSLDIYYKRLFPNVKSARKLSNPYRWSRLPEFDLQYVQLFNKLNTLFEQKSRASYLRTASSNESAKAKEIAKDLNLQKLRYDDICECGYDVFRERDTIAEHKLRTDYDLFLLECQLRQNLSPGDFIPDDPSEISGNAVRFCPRKQQRNFKKWMDEEKLLEKSEEECQRLIKQRQDKNLKEYCSSRIRYVKFKRALAKDLKLISEETD